jgi:hypothetical protein
LATAAATEGIAIKRIPSRRNSSSVKEEEEEEEEEDLCVKYRVVQKATFESHC